MDKYGFVNASTLNGSKKKAHLSVKSYELQFENLVASVRLTNILIDTNIP